MLYYCRGASSEFRPGLEGGRNTSSMWVTPALGGLRILCCLKEEEESCPLLHSALTRPLTIVPERTQEQEDYLGRSCQCEPIQNTVGWRRLTLLELCYKNLFLPSSSFSKWTFPERSLSVWTFPQCPFSVWTLPQGDGKLLIPHVPHRMKCLPGSFIDDFGGQEGAEGGRGWKEEGGSDTPSFRQAVSGCACAAAGTAAHGLVPRLSLYFHTKYSLVILQSCSITVACISNYSMRVLLYK